MADYLIRDANADNNRYTSVLVSEHDNLFVKMRITYWAAMGDDGWARVAEFMQAFPWPEAGWTESGVASAGDER